MKDAYRLLVGLLSSIPIDKYIHLVVCVVIAGVIAHCIPMSRQISAVIAFTVTVIIGASKELYDKHDYGLFDWKDIMSDTLGAIIGALISL